jgi:ABC-type branched-subunit amino acid transport system substrate-binding protein
MEKWRKRLLRIFDSKTSNDTGFDQFIEDAISETNLDVMECDFSEIEPYFEQFIEFLYSDNADAMQKKKRHDFKMMFDTLKKAI